MMRTVGACFFFVLFSCRLWRVAILFSVMLSICWVFFNFGWCYCFCVVFFSGLTSIKEEMVQSCQFEDGLHWS
jgi:hypothetical protein